MSHFHTCKQKLRKAGYTVQRQRKGVILLTRQPANGAPEVHRLKTVSELEVLSQILKK